MKHAIVGMAASKLNVLHWHITDAQSFPLQLNSLPELAEKGAWDHTKVYSHRDVNDLVQFASSYGIR